MVRNGLLIVSLFVAMTGRAVAQGDVAPASDRSSPQGRTAAPAQTPDVELPQQVPTVLAQATTAPGNLPDKNVTVNPIPPAAPDKSSYTLFNPVPTADLRSFSTDRPTKSNSPITVDAGHFQYESDLFNYTHSNAGGATTRLYEAFDPVVKLGLTNKVDLELQFTGYNWLSETAGGQTLHASGVGDLVLRVKFNLIGNEGGIAAAIIPYVKFPTAREPIGNETVDGGIIVPISFPLPYDFTLLVEPEVDVLRNATNGGHHFNYTQLLNISHPLGKELTLYGEVYSALGTDKFTPPVYTADVAVAWLVKDNLQLDIGANFGLTKDSPNLQLYAGIAQRF